MGMLIKLPLLVLRLGRGLVFGFQLKQGGVGVFIRLPLPSTSVSVGSRQSRVSHILFRVSILSRVSLVLVFDHKKHDNPMNSARRGFAPDPGH